MNGLRFLTAILVCLLLSQVVATVSADEPRAGKCRVYLGTYSSGGSRGIYQSRLDVATGRLEPAELAAEAVNPSFVVAHPKGRFLYAISEIGGFGGKKSGALSAFAIDPASGKLTLLNQQATEGDGPCHLAVDPSGRCALVANYGGGSVACLPIGADGRLGPATSFHQHRGASVSKQRQEGPHAHCVTVDPAQRFVLAADLGIDRVMIYRFDPANGTLAPNDPPSFAASPGAGPRHVAFHPGGRIAYVINELNSTVTVAGYDPERGTLAARQTVSTLPAGFHGANTTAEIQVHPSGRFVYGSNRGHDSIAIFAVEPETGRLRPLGHEPTQGRNPRNFVLDPSGRFLLAANQDGANVVVFHIDPETGRLHPTGSSIRVAMPVCIEIVRP
jgi:6-phosphogluconolactonase